MMKRKCIEEGKGMKDRVFIPSTDSEKGGIDGEKITLR